jgi:hypothetical protein
MNEAEDQLPEMDEGDFPLPPVSFEFLTLSLKMQAEMQLGLLHFGEEKDRPKPNLPVARHTIDLLGLIQEKTKGNLSIDEQRLIENTLTELRFRYIQVVELTNKQQAAAKQESAAE